METIVKIHVELKAKVNMNAKKDPCRGKCKYECRDKCKDPCQGESKEKDTSKENFDKGTFFSVKNLFHSDHSAKCTSSQTEKEQATQARQLLICTTFQSSLIWSGTGLWI